MFFSHFMLFPAFLEKIIWEYKPIISHLMFSSCFFFFVCWKYWKVPLHLQLLAKWEVVSPNTVVDIGHFIMRLKYDKNCGVSFWTCSREISGDRVALFSIGSGCSSMLIRLTLFIQHGVLWHNEYQTMTYIFNNAIWYLHYGNLWLIFTGFDGCSRQQN